MDNGRTIIITSLEFTPEDAARIPKRQRRRNTFRGARELTRHLIKYGPPRPEDDELEERFSANDDEEEEEEEEEDEAIDCPLPRAAKAVRHCSQVTSTIHDTNRHLKVKPPPQRIVVKGTVKGRIVPPATASSLQHQRQQGKQCQETNSSLQLQRGSAVCRSIRSVRPPAYTSFLSSHPRILG
uniref:Uncharacterized protein n=1 Tax=Oryza barthii TaxID=65489 RepID=A0A0D3FKB8_9ORYZ